MRKRKWLYDKNSSANVTFSSLDLHHKGRTLVGGTMFCFSLQFSFVGERSQNLCQSFYEILYEVAKQKCCCAKVVLFF